MLKLINRLFNALGVAVFLLAGMEGIAIADSGGSLLGLPVPADRQGLPGERVAVELGRELFGDARLSGNGSKSCAGCHDPADPSQMWKSAGKQTARKPPSLWNAGYYSTYYWDGRASSLEEAVLQTLEDPEQIGSTRDKLEARLNSDARYRERFRSLGKGMTLEAVANMLSSYIRTLRSGNSPFDQFFFSGRQDALSPSARLGWKVFRGKGRCDRCHSVGEREALFTDQRYYDLNLEGMKIAQDPGRYLVTKREKDWAAFRTPSLRNVALRAPYMHNGSLRTLEEIVEFYDRGGLKYDLGRIKNACHDRGGKSHPLNLTVEEKAGLVAFLNALTGEGLARAKAANEGMRSPQVAGAGRTLQRTQHEEGNR